MTELSQDSTLDASWFYEACLKIDNSDSNSIKGDRQKRRSLVILAVAFTMFPANVWSDMLIARNICPENIRSKHKLALAVAAVFNLNPRSHNAIVAKQASQTIDRLSLTAEWLVCRIQDLKDNNETFIPCESSIDQLESLLLENGGITRVSDLQRSTYRPRRKSEDDKTLVLAKRLVENRDVFETIELIRNIMLVAKDFHDIQKFQLENDVLRCRIVEMI